MNSQRTKKCSPALFLPMHSDDASSNETLKSENTLGFLNLCEQLQYFALHNEIVGKVQVAGVQKTHETTYQYKMRKDDDSGEFTIHEYKISSSDDNEVSTIQFPSVKQINEIIMSRHSAKTSLEKLIELLRVPLFFYLTTCARHMQDFKSHGNLEKDFPFDSLKILVDAPELNLWLHSENRDLLSEIRSGYHDILRSCSNDGPKRW